MDIQTAKKVITAASKADDAVIMEGPHGIGKSAIVKQFAEENGYHLEELFLSHQEVGDLIGIPHTIEKDGEMITCWSKPPWLQRMESAQKIGKPSILFLDELNRAPIDVRQSALQLVLERKIHEHSLPVIDDQRTMIVSAINPADEYQVDEMDAALLDRFLNLKIEVDAPAFLAWGRNANLNRMVLDFISEYPDRLHWMPTEDGTGSSPRSWAKLANYMDNIDEIEEEILFPIIKGKVGTEIAAQFFQFIKNYEDVVKVEDIENLVNQKSETVGNIEELAEHVSELLSSTETIHKTELAHQLAQKYMPKDNILVFLAFLYSLEIEICVAFLKGYRKDEPDFYKKLAAIDTELNDKELFKKIVQASDRS